MTQAKGNPDRNELQTSLMQPRSSEYIQLMESTTSTASPQEDGTRMDGHCFACLSWGGWYPSGDSKKELCNEHHRCVLVWEGKEVTELPSNPALETQDCPHTS